MALARAHDRRLAHRAAAVAVVVGVLVLMNAGGPAGAAASRPGPFLGHFHTFTSFGSTVPANGDVNPYGIVTVPRSMGRLVGGDALISNFNDRGNLQGTGNTLVEVSSTGGLTVFARIGKLPGACPGGVGLTTALSLLPGGFVVVGSLPTKDGTAATARAGCLIVLSDSGTVVETWSGGDINGPWDMTAVAGSDFAALFVTNVLNGTVAASPNVVDRGTVVRLIVALHGAEMPKLVSEKIIAAGFAERTDPAALVIGPTGVALGAGDTLYVADTLNSRVAAVPDALVRTTTEAGGGHTVSLGGALNGPLGLMVAPGGDILTANADDGNVVETTPAGQQVDTVTFDPTGAGVLFGLALAPRGAGVWFVDDGDNTLRSFH